MNYWMRVRSHTHPMVEECYGLQSKWAETGQQSWGGDVKGILDHLGFSYAWHFEPGGNRFLAELKRRCMDISFHRLRARIDMKPTLDIFQKGKTCYGPEEYLEKDILSTGIGTARELEVAVENSSR